MTFRWLKDAPDLVGSVREVFVEYQAELGIDLCFQDFEEELAGLPGKYGPPRGAILLVFDGDLLAACGALRDLGDDVAEIKRLYVRPEFRRKGFARRISVQLLDQARDFGYADVRLDTLRRLAGARELYESLGFAEIEPYNFNPEPDIVYMELRL
jgi:GNAT superfamily N-acetyltransferase